jgi:hypothetical protein
MRTKARDVLLLLLVYVVLFAVGSVFYVLCFRTPLFNGMTVFFYRGIALILFWGGVVALAMAVLKLTILRRIITFRDILLLLCAFCCIHIVFFTHLPVTAERSISVFMLGYLDENQGSAFSKAEIETFFIERYVEEFGAFDKRLDEQILSGNVERTTDGSYRITKQGEALIDLYDRIADWYGIDKKLIHPEGS